MSRLLLQTATVMSGGALLLRGLALSGAVSVAYFILHALFEVGLRGSVLPAQGTAGPSQSTLPLAIVGAILALLGLRQMLKYAPALLSDGFYMHPYNGLYITRQLQRAWPGLPARFPQARGILVIGSGINEIDASGEDKARELRAPLKQQGVALTFSSPKGQVAAVFERAGLMQELGPGNVFLSKEAAVTKASSRFDVAAN